MQADIKWMLENRSRHPATLQAVHLWHQRLKEQELHQQNGTQLLGPHLPVLRYHYARPVQPDPDDMRDGFRSAIQEFEDPAAAMQHVLFCMYEGLAVKPPSQSMTHFTCSICSLVSCSSRPARPAGKHHARLFYLPLLPPFACTSRVFILRRALHL